MSQKRKSQSKGFVDKFFHHVLFTQRFRFETSVSIDTVMRRLKDGFGQTYGSWSKTRARYMFTSERVDDQHHQIDMRARDKSLHYTIVHSVGSVEGDDNGTVIVGEIRFGIAYLFLLGLSVLWIFFIFWLFNFYLSSWFMGLVMLPPLFTFVDMFWKRHKLLKDFKKAIEPRMSDRQFEKRKHRLEDHQTKHQLDEIDDGAQAYGKRYQS